MPIKKLKTYLKKEKISFELIPHPLTYTAQETAQSAHIPGSQMAKTVLLWIDQRMAMAVLQAPETVDLKALKTVAHAKEIRLATENEFNLIFPTCEVGAFPPFGPLYHMPVYVDILLSKQKHIIFNAGMHTELMKMLFSDYKKCVHPKIAHLAKKKQIAL